MMSRTTKKVINEEMGKNKAQLEEVEYLEQIMMILNKIFIEHSEDYFTIVKNLVSS